MQVIKKYSFLLMENLNREKSEREKKAFSEHQGE